MQNLPDLVCFLVYNVYNVFVKGPFSIFDPVKTVLRYFKHTFDKTNNNVNFFSHFFSQSNRYEPQPHFHSIRAWELVNILCCHSIIFDSNSARAHRDWKWRMTPQEEVSICSLHASRGFSPRQSCNVSFILLQCCCCNPHFLSCGCPRMRIQQTLPVVMFPPSFNPQCSSSICHLEKCSATHTHTPKAIRWQIQIYTKTMLLQWM